MKSPKQAQLASLCELAQYEFEEVEWRKAGSEAAGWYCDDMFLGDTFTNAQAYLLKKARDVVDISYKFEDMKDVAAEEIEIEDIELNDEQTKVFDEIIDQIEKSRGSYILKGFAGTGKTTVMQMLSRDCKELNLAFTAPTNKAVKVLRNKIQNHKCLTIHQLLNLKIKKSQGRTFLEATGQPALNTFDAIVIDESSMLNEEVMGYLYRYMKSTSASLIFVGDPKQLPPVGEEKSMVFDLNAPSYTLENIVRQAEGNPILENTKRLREMGNYYPEKLIITNDMESETGCIIVNPTKFMDFLKTSFDSDEFARNHDYIRYLAWTNDRVFQVNKGIHGILYGTTECPYSIGERIMAREPILDGEIKNCEECIVQDIINVDDWMGFPAWKLVVYSEAGVLAEIYVLKEEAEFAFNKFKNECISAKNWKDFYSVTESFSDIQHAYAMTVHKSQGSTFDNVIVDVPNILKNSYNTKELMSLMYVAFSRPRQRVYLRN